MEKDNKQKATFTLTPENLEWIRALSKSSRVSMSLFVDSLITGMKASMKQGVSEREAMAMGLEQIAKGLRH